MQAKFSAFVYGALLAAAVGCGQSSSGPDASGQAAGPGPEKVTAQFMEALRTGNRDVASGLLTPLARQKTEEAKLEVGLPASPSASFQVSEVETVAEDAAHVASTWSDIQEDGQKSNDKIVWILRREPEGWRIAGMATKVFDDALPLILNFEDPADMVRKQQLAEEEMARRAAEEEKSQAARAKKHLK